MQPKKRVCFPYWQGYITLLIFLAFFAGFFAIGIMALKSGKSPPKIHCTPHTIAYVRFPYLSNIDPCTQKVDESEHMASCQIARMQGAGSFMLSFAQGDRED